MGISKYVLTESKSGEDYLVENRFSDDYIRDVLLESDLSGIHFEIYRRELRKMFNSFKRKKVIDKTDQRIKNELRTLIPQVFSFLPYVGNKPSKQQR